MTEHTLINDQQLVEMAVAILVREMGSVEAGRFLALRTDRHIESVQRHRNWQAGLDQEKFFNEVFGDSG
jgi:hypothetical protein